MASGVVIALLGLWIVLRTISSGSGGNLVDWLMSLGGGSSSTSKQQPSKQQPGAGASAATTPKNVFGQPAPPGTGPRPQGPHVLGGPR